MDFNNIFYYYIHRYVQERSQLYHSCLNMYVFIPDKTIYNRELSVERPLEEQVGKVSFYTNIFLLYKNQQNLSLLTARRIPVI